MVFFDLFLLWMSFASWLMFEFFRWLMRMIFDEKGKGVLWFSFVDVCETFVNLFVCARFNDDWMMVFCIFFLLFCVMLLIDDDGIKCKKRKKKRKGSEMGWMERSERFFADVFWFIECGRIVFVHRTVDLTWCWITFMAFDFFSWHPCHELSMTDDDDDDFVFAIFVFCFTNWWMWWFEWLMCSVCGYCVMCYEWWMSCILDFWLTDEMETWMSFFCFDFTRWWVVAEKKWKEKKEWVCDGVCVMKWWRMLVFCRFLWMSLMCDDWSFLTVPWQVEFCIFVYLFVFFQWLKNDDWLLLSFKWWVMDWWWSLFCILGWGGGWIESVLLLCVLRFFFLFVCDDCWWVLWMDLMMIFCLLTRCLFWHCDSVVDCFTDLLMIDWIVFRDCVWVDDWVFLVVSWCFLMMDGWNVWCFSHCCGGWCDVFEVFVLFW